jgi:hypothetical protein
MRKKRKIVDGAGTGDQTVARMPVGGEIGGLKSVVTSLAGLDSAGSVITSLAGFLTFAHHFFASFTIAARPAVELHNGHFSGRVAGARPDALKLQASHSDREDNSRFLAGRARMAREVCRDTRRYQPWRGWRWR